MGIAVSSRLANLKTRDKQDEKTGKNDADTPSRKKHMAYRKKHKPYILKYKALISKYMPCIFHLFKCLKDNNLQKLSKTFYSLDLQPVPEHPLKREKK